MGKDLDSTARYERKFFIEDLSSHEVECILKTQSFFFSDIFKPRYINNIYFDSLSMQSYYENVFGDANRWKARIRWYGDLCGHIAKPTLEFKIKKGLVGFKDSFSLNAFDFDNDCSPELIAKCIEDWLV